MNNRFKYFLAGVFLIVFPKTMAFADRYWEADADFVAPQYWDTHQAFYGTIVNSYTNGAGDIAIVFNVIDKVTPDVQVTNHTLLASQTSLWEDSPWSDHLRVGADFLFFESNQQPPGLQFIENESDTNLAKSLISIGKIHERRDDQMLLESCTSQDDLVTKYCLNQILFRPDMHYRGEDLHALTSLRDDVRRPAEIRIDAEEAILKFTKGFTNTEGNYDALRRRFLAVNPSLNDEYFWIKNLMSGKPPARRADMDYLAERLLDFQSFKVDNVHLLASLANDSESSYDGQMMRVSMCSKLNDLRLFDSHHYTTDDFNRQDVLGCIGPNLEFAFNTCLNLIKDPDPEMRSVAAFIACSLARCALPEEGKILKQRAKEALESAITTEEDRLTKSELRETLNDLETR